MDSGRLLEESRYELSVARAIARQAGWLDEEDRDGRLKLKDCLMIAQMALAEAVEIMEEQNGDYELLFGCRMLEGVLSDKLYDEIVCPDCMSRSVVEMGHEDGSYWYSICSECDYEWNKEV